VSEESRHFTTELAVIGSGIAGFSASIFALNRGLTVAQVGNTGAIAYTTGYLDLFGKLDASRELVNDPYQALAMVRRQTPKHPLARLTDVEIVQAFQEVTDFLGSCGISYSAPGMNNIVAMTPAGTLKPTLSLPRTMAAGPKALAAGDACVIIDFKGLKGFSGRQVVANLSDRWPRLGTARLRFPGMDHGEIYPEVMARALEVASIREQLAPLLHEAAGKSRVIGLPALLGMHAPDVVHAELERLTGLTIFEIPTMPPSVPGIRLREMFEQEFPKKGVTLIPQQKVAAIDFHDDGGLLRLADNYGPITIRAKAILLATGRFLSGGLEAGLHGIVEPLVGLPVTQPEGRAAWYREQYTDCRGHDIHKAGIEVDDNMRPLGKDGQIFHPHLFAAGVVLAHQDWIRNRCGAGVAIATAFRAVGSIVRLVESRPVGIVR
jgi:glycerol-3-phosphate dehydrogenase subunit B